MQGTGEAREDDGGVHEEEGDDEGAEHARDDGADAVELVPAAGTEAKEAPQAVDDMQQARTASTARRALLGCDGSARCARSKERIIILTVLILIFVVGICRNVGGIGEVDDSVAKGLEGVWRGRVGRRRVGAVCGAEEGRDALAVDGDAAPRRAHMHAAREHARQPRLQQPHGTHKQHPQHRHPAHNLQHAAHSLRALALLKQNENEKTFTCDVSFFFSFF